MLGTISVIGLLSGTDREASRLDAIWRGLNEAGYVEGHNVAIEYRWAEGHNERLADIARFEDYVTRQGTKILKLDRRELPTPPRRIHRKACGVTAVTAVSRRAAGDGLKLRRAPVTALSDQ
jgi:hypothetical protein